MSRKKALPPPSGMIEALYVVLAERKNASPEESYTARLYASGTRKMAQKLGEEAVEAVIAALRCEEHSIKAREELIAESADLIYHLCAIWAHLEIRPGEIAAELERRSGTSGLVEKASRGISPQD